MKKKKIVFAPQKEVEYLSMWIDEIVAAVCRISGLPPGPVFISDESELGHFPLKKDGFRRLSKDLGIPVHPEDTFIGLAKRMKKARGG